MAFSSVTVSATYVTVSGGQGTVDDITTAVNNTSVMEKVGNVHTIKGDRGLYIGNTAGTQVTLSSGQTLNCLKTTNSYAVYIADRCEMITAAGTTLGCTSGSASAGIGGYVYIYGKFTSTGTSESRVIIDQPRLFRFFSRSGSIAEITCSLEYTDFRNIRYQYQALPEIFSSEAYYYSPRITLSYVRVYNETASGGTLNYGYGLGLYSQDYSHCVFDNCVFDKLYDALFLYGANAKFTNCTFSNIYARVVSGYGGGAAPHTYSQAYNETTGDVTQSYLTFKDCIFDTNYTAAGSSTRAFQAMGGGPYKLLDCEFKNSAYGIYHDYNNFFYVHNPTFTNVTSTQKYVGAGCQAINDVWELDLTVVDNAGNPIPNASIFVYQADMKEKATLVSDSNGEVYDHFGELPIFTEQQMYSHSSGGLYYNWSQSGANCHYMVISKPGYQTYTRQVYFTADQTIVAALQPIQGIRSIPQ